MLTKYLFLYDPFLNSTTLFIQNVTLNIMLHIIMFHNYWFWQEYETYLALNINIGFYNKSKVNNILIYKNLKENGEGKWFNRVVTASLRSFHFHAYAVKYCLLYAIEDYAEENWLKRAVDEQTSMQSCSNLAATKINKSDLRNLHVYCSRTVSTS